VGVTRQRNYFQDSLLKDNEEKPQAAWMYSLSSLKSNPTEDTFRCLSPAWLFHFIQTLWLNFDQERLMLKN